MTTNTALAALERAVAATAPARPVGGMWSMRGRHPHTHFTAQHWRAEKALLAHVGRAFSALQDNEIMAIGGIPPRLIEPRLRTETGTVYGRCRARWVEAQMEAGRLER